MRKCVGGIMTVALWASMVQADTTENTKMGGQWNIAGNDTAGFGGCDGIDPSGPASGG
ncbi:hypothetical protein [uncultured Ruegeria sp.]|uniref:hypothetical protein n=1 Tax=uncultured Ruegeria sp. TaxID=259304 RepID=UPI00260B79A8|nr:hypothetical protein [uncultured Ruegeria sp.]